MSMNAHADNTPNAVLPRTITVTCTFFAAVGPWLAFVGFGTDSRLAGLVVFALAIPGVLLYGVLASYWARAIAVCGGTRPRATAWASLAALWAAVALFASWPCWILRWLM